MQYKSNIFYSTNEYRFANKSTISVASTILSEEHTFDFWWKIYNVHSSWYRNNKHFERRHNN